jgi:hypothetical protein
MKPSLFMSLTRVCTSFLSFHCAVFKFETELFIYPKPDSNTLKHNEKTAQLMQKLSAGHPIHWQGEPQHQISSLSDAGLAGGAFPFHNLSSQPTGVDDKSRRVPQEDDDGESSTDSPSTLATRLTHQLQFPTNSHRQSIELRQEKQQSQPVYPWSAHTSPSGQWPSPFPRRLHTLSATLTATGELFLFGGNTNDRTCNDLYVISTRDFSITLLQTRGDIPSPRYGHCVVLTSTTLLTWGGSDLSNRNAQNQSIDDSFYLLNLGSSDLFLVKTRSS